MSKIEYNSESREWYIASGLIFGVTFICYSFLNWYILPDQAEILTTIANAIHLSFALLFLSSVFLAIQGYRFRNGKALLLRKDGEEILFDLEKLFIDADLSVKELSCINVNSLGLWRPVGRLVLSEGEIEVKEIWFYVYYYRTQIAFRDKVPDEIIEKFISNLA
tara:strand:+ start:6455 stop:6946 length:492 start_codon:yes stop_codon:yes gene_type:complete